MLRAGPMQENAMACGSRPDAPLDLRGLPAPVPMERALAAVERLGAGVDLELLTPQMPYPLIQLLGERGFAVAAERCADGTARLRVRRPAGR
ncbi:DUF2249 domain-containing protein [Lysobacter sp. N42]|uniref:DUF2249 domain-containing protein n=1 Tax=Lysobacter sp. N42 TaxID=2545719 RepID=UPI001FB5E866|nr:DUF2249 domain-containing protein [Lysobacter sp. N42]